VKRALLVSFVVAAIAACKQGAGDRCVVNSDCRSGLICNQAKNQCESGNSQGGIDATVPDGPAADAKVFLDAGSAVAP
jgi:hypothetical protein